MPALPHTAYPRSLITPWPARPAPAVSRTGGGAPGWNIAEYAGGRAWSLTVPWPTGPLYGTTPPVAVGPGDGTPGVPPGAGIRTEPMPVTGE